MKFFQNLFKKIVSQKILKSMKKFWKNLPGTGRKNWKYEKKIEGKAVVESYADFLEGRKMKILKFKKKSLNIFLGYSYRYKWQMIAVIILSIIAS